MNTIGHYVWETIKLAANCVGIYFVLCVAIPKIATLHPGAILVIGVLSGIILGDYLAKHNRGHA